jgi:transposase
VLPMFRNVASGAGAVQSRSGEGAKRDFPDAERLVKRLVANELTLSFLPDTEQRLWPTVRRRRYQQTCDKVRSQNQLEALLEEAHLKLSPKICALRLTGRASRNGKCRSIYLTFSRFHG